MISYTPTSCSIGAMPYPVSSPLLSLPSELRTRIFYFSLLPSSPSLPATIRTSAQTHHSLQLVCRTINSETRCLPFHTLPLGCPNTFGSNVTGILRILRRMQPWQISAIRRVELSVLGSVYEASEAARVLRYLKHEEYPNTKDWRAISPDIAIMMGAADADDRQSFTDTPPTKLDQRQQQRQQQRPQQQEAALPLPTSELRSLSVSITSRDVMTPKADSAVGMEKMLDLDASPVFAEVLRSDAGLSRFPCLKRVSVQVQLGKSLREVYTPEWAREYEGMLKGRMNRAALSNKGLGTVDGLMATSTISTTTITITAAATVAAAAADASDDEKGKTNHGIKDVDVQVSITHDSKAVDAMFAYFLALEGNEDWWGSRSDLVAASVGAMGAAMMTLSSPAGALF